MLIRHAERLCTLMSITLKLVSGSKPCLPTSSSASTSNSGEEVVQWIDNYQGLVGRTIIKFVEQDGK
jgi:hypothetical protein